MCGAMFFFSTFGLLLIPSNEIMAGVIVVVIFATVTPVPPPTRDPLSLVRQGTEGRSSFEVPRRRPIPA